VRNYELMAIFKPDLEEQSLQVAVDRLNTTITTKGGEVASSDPWGRRRLAYPLQDYREGIFTITQMKLDPKNTVELERSLKLNDQILRYLLVRGQ